MLTPKFLISPLIAVALFASPIRADQLIQDQPPIEDVQSEENVESLNPSTSDTAATPDQTDDEDLPSGKEVSTKDPGDNGAARRRTWQNFLLAAGAIAVAVVAIVLASRNNGHKSHSN